MGAPDNLLLVAGGGFLVALLASFAATRTVLAQLRRRNLMDVPNERSSHSVPTPRGGGWGVVIGAFAACLAALPFTGSAPWMIGLGLAILIGVILSWRDDLGGLPVRVRLCAQFAAAAAALAAIYWTEAPVFDAITYFGVPKPVVLVAIAPILLIGYVWFINLYNFMDGIDGISAIETISVLAGIVAIAAFGGTMTPILTVYPLVFVGAALGFLAWNWHPAKVFLGDVGSIPLGIAVGFFLLAFAAHGYLAAAMILPLYYIADATLTLFRRLLRGEKIWQAHRTHWYQKAAMTIGHRRTVFVILAGNLGLGIFAFMAQSHPLPALAMALTWTLLLLGVLSRLARVSDPMSTA